MAFNYNKIKECLDCGISIIIKSGHEKRCFICQKKYFKIYQKNYRQKYIEHYRQISKKATKKWREKHPERAKEIRQKYRNNHRKLCIQRTVISNRSYRQKAREIVLNHYGGNPPKCACCGENEKMFLTIDHINGGGSKHRKEFNNVSGGLAGWIIKNNFPKDFQILCMNCNFGKFKNEGVCPHKNDALQCIPDLANSESSSAGC